MMAFCFSVNSAGGFLAGRDCRSAARKSMNDESVDFFFSLMRDFDVQPEEGISCALSSKVMNDLSKGSLSSCMAGLIRATGMGTPRRR